MKDDVEIEVYLAEQKMRKKYEAQLAGKDALLAGKDALLAQIVSSKDAENASLLNRIKALEAALAAKA